MWGGSGGQPEQEVVSSPGAVLLGGGCRRSGLLPGAWVSPARPLPLMPQLEGLLRDGYHGAGTGQSRGLSSMYPWARRGSKGRAPALGSR